MIENRFSPELLNDFDRLKTLFNAEAELKEIDATLQAKNFRYLSRWHVVPILVAAPFAAVLSVFLRAISFVFHYVSLTSWSRTLYVLSAQASRLLFNLWHIFEKNCLIPAMNCHLLSTADVYHQPAIKTETIPSPQIRDHFKKDQIEFYSPEGICRGGVIWFNHLYHLSKNKPGSVEERLIAIAKQFIYGMQRQAALMQAFSWGLDTPLLGTKAINLAFSCDFTKKEVETKLKADAFMKKPNLLFNILQEDGAYTISYGFDNSPGHIVSYIKAKEEQWLWDPSQGLYSIKNAHELKKVLALSWLNKASIKVRMCNLSLDSKKEAENVIKLIREKIKDDPRAEVTMQSIIDERCPGLSLPA